MKSRFLLPLLGLCALSCHDMPYEEAQSDEMTLLKASVARCETRTWLDSANPSQTEDGENYSVYWSDGDRVNVNGQVSSPLSVMADAKISQAEFALKSVQPPYNVIYPSSIVSGNGYMEDGTIEVTLPQQQKYNATTFAEGAAVLYGFSAVEGETVQLYNACAALRVSLKDDEVAEISDVTLTSNAAPISGSFLLNPQSGTLVPENEGAGNEIVLTEVKAQLSQEGNKDFYFTVPAGEYHEGFEFSFYRSSDRRKMICKWTPKAALIPGRIYCFDDVEFVPGAKDIETAEDWEAFAKAINEGTDLDMWVRKGTVTIGKDFTVDNPTKIIGKDGKFTYNLDGKGHTITVTNGRGPLFRGIRTRIKDLTVAGTITSPYSAVSAIADSLLSGGSIVNCTNKATLSSSFTGNGGQYGGGIVRVIFGGGTITGCTNEGAITLTPDASNAFANRYVGGIVGQVCQTEAVTIKDCSNNAAITIKPRITNTEYNITCAGIGGIAGWVRNVTHNVTFYNCDNLANGMIIIAKDDIGVAGKPSSVCVGGIVGIAAGYNPTYHALSTPNETNGVDLTMVGCDNLANIYNCAYFDAMSGSSNVKVYTAGLAGALIGKAAKHVSVSNCTVKDCQLLPYDIVNGSDKAGYCAVAAGMIGFGGYVDIDKCISKPTVIGNGKRQSVSFAGVIGFALRPFTLKNSYIWTEGYFNRLPIYQNNRASVAVVPCKYGTSNMTPAGDIKGSEIKDCQVGGALYVSQKCYDVTNTDDLSQYCTDKTVGATLFTTLNDFTSNLVRGQGYTANDNVAHSGLKQWNGQL